MTLITETRLYDVHLDTENASIEEMESIGESLAAWQRGVNWWIGDLAIQAQSLLGDNYSQVFPEWVSPGLIARCKAVSEAYPAESRNLLATWTIHMRHANKPDRIDRVNAAVEGGKTSDEDRAKPQGSNRWLLAIDVNYFIHRFWFSGAGIEAASGVANWIQRTEERLREKGLTDLVCCFDSRTNHRKQLTEGWEDKYKDRPAKDPELGQQIGLVYELLQGYGYCCASVEGMEADDVMASYAKQFDGRITLMTQDKDCRQCLSAKCNMLLDVKWVEDEVSGEHHPEYEWVSSKSHTEDTGISPEQWCDYQSIMGDNCDGIKGAIGIGQKIAADLIQEFETVEAAIEAAKADDERIKPKKREALIAFEPNLETTRKLVTLRNDLQIPQHTEILEASK